MIKVFNRREKFLVLKINKLYKSCSKYKELVKEQSPGSILHFTLHLRYYTVCDDVNTYILSFVIFIYFILFCFIFYSFNILFFDIFLTCWIIKIIKFFSICLVVTVLIDKAKLLTS